MAITDTHFLEYDANDANDIGFYCNDYSMTMIPRAIQVEPSLVSAPVCAAIAGYTRTWMFRDCKMTKAVLTTLAYTVAEQNIEYNDTYPRINIMNDPTPGWSTYACKIDAIADKAQGSDVINRLVDVTVSQRGTSPYTFVLDHDSDVGSAVTVILDTNESVQQALRFTQRPQQVATAPDRHEFTLEGITPLRATISGYVARTALDTLQQLLEDQTSAGMEMEGDIYDTQSTDGFYDSNLTAAKAIIKSFQQDQYWPGDNYLVHVVVEVEKVVTG